MKVRNIVSRCDRLLWKDTMSLARNARQFVRETGHPPGDECGKDSFKWNKQLLVVSRMASSISHEKKKPR